MATYNGVDVDLYNDNLLPGFSNWDVSGGSNNGDSITLNNNGYASITLDDVVGSSAYLYYSVGTDANLGVNNNYNNILYFEVTETYINYGDDNSEKVYKKNKRIVNITQSKNTLVPMIGRDLRMTLKLYNRTGGNVNITSATLCRSRDVSEKQFTSAYENMNAELVIPLVAVLPDIGRVPDGYICRLATMDALDV